MKLISNISNNRRHLHYESSCSHSRILALTKLSSENKNNIYMNLDIFISGKNGELTYFHSSKRCLYDTVTPLCKKANRKHFKFCHGKDTLRGSVREIIKSGVGPHWFVSVVRVSTHLRTERSWV